MGLVHLLLSAEMLVASRLHEGVACKDRSSNRLGSSSLTHQPGRDLTVNCLVYATDSSPTTHGAQRGGPDERVMWWG